MHLIFVADRKSLFIILYRFGNASKVIFGEIPLFYRFFLIGMLKATGTFC